MAVERIFTCNQCGSIIESWGDGKPISGCPHHNPEKRGHIQKREALITLNLGFQYEPGVGWVVSAFGLIGDGKTMDDAVADIQAKITKAGW